MDVTNSFKQVFESAQDDLANMGIKPGENNSIKDVAGIVAYVDGNKINAQVMGNPLLIAQIMHSILRNTPEIAFLLMLIHKTSKE